VPETLEFLWDTRKHPARCDAKPVLHAARAVVIGVMLEGLFEVNLGISPVLSMFLGVKGCGYTALEKTGA
jgi:hypothetical protein